MSIIGSDASRRRTGNADGPLSAGRFGCGLGTGDSLKSRSAPLLHGAVCQETWLRIHQVRHTYRPGEPVLPWFYAIARHIRVDQYRKVRRTETREQQVEQLPDTAAIERDRGPDLEALLGELPESQREVVAMLKISGMSLEEVARATASSVGSVKQKAHRAYEKLRELLTSAGFNKVGNG